MCRRGAVRVIEGELAEDRLCWAARAPPPPAMTPGQSFRVRRRRASTMSATSADEPTISLHLYSPPLWRMGYYDVGDDGRISPPLGELRRGADGGLSRSLGSADERRVRPARRPGRDRLGQPRPGARGAPARPSWRGSPAAGWSGPGSTWTLAEVAPGRLNVVGVARGIGRRALAAPERPPRHRRPRGDAGRAAGADRGWPHVRARRVRHEGGAGLRSCWPAREAARAGLRGDVTVPVAVCDEEFASIGTQAGWPRRCGADAAIVTEPTASLEVGARAQGLRVARDRRRPVTRRTARSPPSSAWMRSPPRAAAC